MQKRIRPILFLVLAGLLLVSFAGFASAKEDAGDKHSFTLGYWKHSSESEQRAFLMGFISALDMEKMWQSSNPQPIGKSTVSAWTRGLGGLSYPEICGALNAYVAEHPDRMNESVLKVLADLYVRPKMTPAECKEADAHYAKISRR